MFRRSYLNSCLLDIVRAMMKKKFREVWRQYLRHSTKTMFALTRQIKPNQWWLQKVSIGLLTRCMLIILKRINVTGQHSKILIQGRWQLLKNFIEIMIGFYKVDSVSEITVAYNEIEDDDYAFFVEDLRPIQLSRFSFDQYQEGREQFDRDAWIDVVLRSVGLEPSKLPHRVKLHFIARLLPLVEPNYNFIELGPRGTGKSYFFSELSPYSTLISGGQATKATLFITTSGKKLAWLDIGTQWPLMKSVGSRSKIPTQSK